MSTPNCAVIDATSTVINIIVALPTDTPPEGCTLIPLYFAQIGYTWDGTNFNPPIPPDGPAIDTLDSTVEGI